MLLFHFFLVDLHLFSFLFGFGRGCGGGVGLEYRLFVRLKEEEGFSKNSKTGK